MDNKKIKSLWEVMVPQGTADPEMRVTTPIERKKIVYNPDPEVRPLVNPIPIVSTSGQADIASTPSTASVKPSVSLPASGPQTNPIKNTTEKTHLGHRPLTSTNPPNTGSNAGKAQQEEFNTTRKKENAGSSETKNSSDNSWYVIAAIVLLVIIIICTYFINDAIKEKRKKRVDKNEDDLFDSFFDSKTGNIIRLTGIAVALFIAVLALLYSTKILTQAIKGVHDSTKA